MKKHEYYFQLAVPSWIKELDRTFRSLDEHAKVTSGNNSN